MAKGGHAPGGEILYAQYAYTADGAVIKRNFSEEGGQPPALRWTERYEFNANGDLTRFAWDRVNIAAPKPLQAWASDASGKMTRRRIVFIAEECTEVRETEDGEYDPEGGRTRFESRTGLQAPVPEVETWQ